MTTPVPSSRQNLIVDGNLELKTKPSADGSTLGRMVFTDPTLGDLGALKIFGGGPGNYRLVLDTSKVLRGVAFRTTATQGSTQEGGTNLPYTVDIQSNYVSLNNYTIIQPMEARYPGLDFSGPLLNIRKTKDSFNTGYSNMVDVQMTTFSPNQSILMEIGQSGNYGVGLGYKNPVGGSTSISSYGFLSHRISASPFRIENLKFYRDGNVSIPARLDVGTISAGTYLNLPAITPSQILPITLDAVNGHVGINKTVPTEALDVVGSIRATGGVDAESVTGNNTFFSGTMSAAAVDTGSVTSTGSIAGATGDFVGNVDVGGDLSVNGGVVSAQLDVLGTMTAGTVSATTYLNLPTSDILPITLDKVNNRVGVNITTPSVPFEVQGEAWTRGDHTVDGYMKANAVTVGYQPGVASGWTLYRDSSTSKLFISPISATGVPNTANDVTINYNSGKVSVNQIAVGLNDTVIQAGTGSPEGVATAGPGSLFLRTDGVLGNQLYSKLSGTGTTGWESYDQPFKYVNAPLNTFTTPTATARDQVTLIYTVPANLVPLNAGEFYNVQIIAKIRQNASGVASQWSYAVSLGDATNIVLMSQQQRHSPPGFLTAGNVVFSTSDLSGAIRYATINTTIVAGGGSPLLQLYAISSPAFTGSQQILANDIKIVVNRFRAWY